MNKDNEMKEIAKILNECCNEYDEYGNHIRNKCFNCEYWSNDNGLCCSYNKKEATALYNAGYRKAEEVRKETAREIVGLINNAIFAYLGVKSLEEAEKLSLIDSTLTYDIVTDKLQIISQKYGVEVEDCDK